MFLSSLTVSNTSSFVTLSVQLIFSILLQYHTSYLPEMIYVGSFVPYRPPLRYMDHQNYYYLPLVSYLLATSTDLSSQTKVPLSRGLFLAFLYRHGTTVRLPCSGYPALKAFHCTESSWKNKSRDFCLVPTGKLHHTLAEGERERDPNVGQIKVAGRWVRHCTRWTPICRFATCGAVWG
jgi:hypothetical protein